MKLVLRGRFLGTDQDGIKIFVEHVRRVLYGAEDEGKVSVSGGWWTFQDGAGYFTYERRPDGSIRIGCTDFGPEEVAEAKRLAPPTLLDRFGIWLRTKLEEKLEKSSAKKQ